MRLIAAFLITLGLFAQTPVSSPFATGAGGGGGSGTVTSVGLAGTANQITVTGASPITGTGSWTLSFPAGGVTLPGTTTGTFTGNVTGNASTATALAANPTNCSAGNYPLGIDASGNVENCTAASGGTPGTPVNSVQFNNAGAFAGSANLTETSGGSLSANAPNAMGNIGVVGGGPILASDFGGYAVLDFEENFTGDCSNYCFGQANYFQLDDGNGGSAIGTSVAAFTKAGTTRTLGQMVALNVESQSYGGTIGEIDGLNVYAQNRTTTDVGKLVGNYINIANVSTGNVTEAWAYAATRVENRSSGTIGTYYAHYTEAQGGVAGVTNAYDFWADEQGVFRIKADNTFDSVYQAIPALYNPQFTKYTPGAADFERIVEQWNGNVAEIGTEKGGTGTLRRMRFIGLSVEIPPSLFAALSTPGNATEVYCSDCTVTSGSDNTCAASGTGAFAERVNGAWKCYQ